MRAESRRQKAEGLSRLATLLAYPMPRPQRSASDGEEIGAFFDETAHVTDDGFEELYTTTFDLNPVATLDVGWHLWGEQYERGRFLADLRGVQEQLGIDAGVELPDHLTAVLPVIEKTRDAELIAKTTAAVKKMLAPLEEHGNPYRHVLREVLRVAQASEPASPDHRSAGWEACATPEEAHT